MENMKRLVSLWTLLATESQLSEFVSAKDIAVLTTRSQGEGMTFLTVTLPRLFKSLDAALAASQLETVVGFKSGSNHVYPVFLKKAWETIFNKDGTLRPFEAAQVGAVACIRQLSAIFYKLELDYTPEQESNVISAFLQTEVDLGSLDLTAPHLEGLLERARKVVRRLLAGVNPLEIRPRHGGGSSACQVKPWERYCSFRYIPRLCEVFPYDKYFFYNQTHVCDNMHELLEAEEAEPRARVVFVPKDSRGPRLISCEPREFMFIQQGLMDLLYKTVERQPAIAGQIGFTDQTRNRELAKLGSQDQSYATLDLKEASDRVSWELVRTIFPENWVAALGASRSQSTELPDGTVVPFRKFAPMGSACCFPVEAICFWAIAHAAIGDAGYTSKVFRNRLSKTDMRMSVFGDDVIVPTRFAETVMEALESCGLLINRDKSYWSGSFRESCGGDYFHGHNVTPIRCKQLIHSESTAGSSGNYARARHRTSKLVNNLLAKYAEGTDTIGLHRLYESWYGPTPRTDRWEVKDDQLVVHLDGLWLIDQQVNVPPSYRRRWNPRLCRQEFRVPIMRSVDIIVDSDRWGQVLRRELEKLSEQPTACGTLAKRVHYKYGWIAR